MKKLIVTAALACLAVALFSQSAPGPITVTVAWDANTETDIAGYKVYWRITNSASWLSTNVGPKTTVAIPLSSPASMYQFYATAYNTAALESDPSSSVLYATPPLQPQPVGNPNLNVK